MTEVPQEYPIQFGISADLDVKSKAVIDGNNVTDFGFLALGNLTVDANSEIQPSIFGVHGTEVKNVSNQWSYSPLRYWQSGRYNFAGVMPSSLFNATHDHTTTTQPGTYTASLIKTTNGSQLTLNFGTDGFNLAETQTDLMVAFDSQTVQSASTASPVKFVFEHQLALLNIEVQNGSSPMEIVVNNIKIYGNHKISTGATFSKTDNNETKTDNNATITAAWTLGSITTETEPYRQVNAHKIENLLVFPKSGSNKLTVAVTYTESYGGIAFSKTKYGEININWQAGKIYTYNTNLTSESIVFGAPTVTDWSDGGAADNIPQM